MTVRFISGPGKFQAPYFECTSFVNKLLFYFTLTGPSVTFRTTKSPRPAVSPPMMALSRIMVLCAVSSCNALVVPSRTSTPRMVEIGNTGVKFENVAREWRCKYSPGSEGPGDSASLKACQDLLTEYLPAIKALPNADVKRAVCGGCLDFKVTIVQPLADHETWANADYQPLEEEFMSKLKAIEGTSQHEVQEITFETM